MSLRTPGTLALLADHVHKGTLTPQDLRQLMPIVNQQFQPWSGECPWSKSDGNCRTFEPGLPLWLSLALVCANPLSSRLGESPVFAFRLDASDETNRMPSASQNKLSWRLLSGDGFTLLGYKQHEPLSARELAYLCVPPLPAGHDPVLVAAGDGPDWLTVSIAYSYRKSIAEVGCWKAHEGGAFVCASEPTPDRLGSMVATDEEIHVLLQK